MMVFSLATASDTMLLDYRRGNWDASSDQRLDGTIASCHQVLDVLGEHLDDGPYEVTELARGLKILSRLQIVAGRLPEAAVALDEAVTLLAALAGEGAWYANRLSEYQVERDRVRSRLPEPEALPDRQVFERAARDAGLDPVELAETEAGTAEAVERMRAAEADEPARHGPVRGLLMAWQACLLLADGKPKPARDLADAAVRHLSSFSDRPQRIQASLVVALAVLKRAATALGDTDQANRAGQRATVLYETLVAGDPTYAEDLAP
jgi:hypothetical protein